MKNSAPAGSVSRANRQAFEARDRAAQNARSAGAADEKGKAARRQTRQAGPRLAGVTVHLLGDLEYRNGVGQLG